MGLLHPVPRVNRLNTMCCRALQCVAACSNVLQYEYLYIPYWQTEYNALQCVAACCSEHVCKNLYTLCSQTEYTVLHRVTVCCSVYLWKSIESVYHYLKCRWTQRECCHTYDGVMSTYEAVTSYHMYERIEWYRVIHMKELCPRVKESCVTRTKDSRLCIKESYHAYWSIKYHCFRCMCLGLFVCAHVCVCVCECVCWLSTCLCVVVGSCAVNAVACSWMRERKGGRERERKRERRRKGEWMRREKQREGRTTERERGRENDHYIRFQ